MKPRTIAIGDVHGCLAALEAVLDAVQPRPEDTVVTLGDYIDRGPDSRGVIDRLIKLQRQTRLVPILGNHEEMMIRVLRGDAPMAWWQQYGGVETLASYGYDGDPKVIPAAHLEFLNACRDTHEDAGFLYLHAQYVWDEPLDHQPAEALRWQSLDERFPEPHVSGKTAIVGHTSQKDGEVLDAGYLKCIDTFCHGGGWLTAIEPATGRLWQADRTGRRR
ncbi:metallophosphoesterase family protein [Pirellulimonas nuda]|uniref:metallophosphoesterase family protein n=1 Tax=Pirellulimonas nuda TaxID=2528009 RepID=UPI001E3A0FFB|nr:metallophosphoesterase family protein [Pirellulimonas nuda]